MNRFLLNTSSILPYQPDCRLQADNKYVYISSAKISSLFRNLKSYNDLCWKRPLKSSLEITWHLLNKSHQSWLSYPFDHNGPCDCLYRNLRLQTEPNMNEFIILGISHNMHVKGSIWKRQWGWPYLFPIPAACSSINTIWDRGTAMQHSWNKHHKHRWIKLYPVYSLSNTSVLSPFHKQHGYLQALPEGLYVKYDGNNRNNV